MLSSTSSIVFACMSKACAPPPVGTGGSSSGSSSPSPRANADRVLGDAWDRLEEWSIAHPANRENYQVWDEYVNGEGHKIINRTLRGDPQFDGDEGAYELVSGMSRVFRGASIQTPSPITLYRGVSPLSSFNSKPIVLMKKGDRFEDSGFISTATNLEDTKRFGSVKMVIDVPKGTRVLAGNTSESELILKGGSFEVLDVQGSGTSITIRLRMLSDQ